MFFRDIIAELDVHKRSDLASYIKYLSEKDIFIYGAGCFGRELEKVFRQHGVHMTRGNLIFIKEPLSKFRLHSGQDQNIKSFFWNCNTALGFFLACHFCYSLNLIRKDECLRYINSYNELLNCLIRARTNNAGEFISRLMRECMKIGIMELQSNSIVDIKAALGLGEKNGR